MAFIMVSGSSASTYSTFLGTALKSPKAVSLDIALVYVCDILVPLMLFCDLLVDCCSWLLLFTLAVCPAAALLLLLVLPDLLALPLAGAGLPDWLVTIEMWEARASASMRQFGFLSFSVIKSSTICPYCIYCFLASLILCCLLASSMSQLVACKSLDSCSNLGFMISLVFSDKLRVWEPLCM